MSSTRETLFGIEPIIVQTAIADAPEEAAETGEGEFSNDVRQGPWTFRYLGGALKRQVVYVDGMEHGPKKTLFEDGVLESEGMMEAGLKTGTWCWYYPNGQLEKTGAYVEGQAHGPYVWHHDHGAVRTQGEFYHGKRHGHWTWFDDEGGPKMEKGYDKGTFHGLHVDYFDNGNVKERKTYRYGGKRQGLSQQFYDDGTPRSEAVYRNGYIHGEQKTWDQNGELTTEVLEFGTGPLTKRKKTSLVNQMAKKKDGYAKMGVLEKVVGFGPKKDLLWALIEEGYLDIAGEPHLWAELEEGLDAGRSKVIAEIVAKLTPATVAKANYTKLVESWPVHLDELVVKAYACEPEAFDIKAEDLPEDVWEGFATVLRRFGKIEADAVPETFVRKLARTQVEKGLFDLHIPVDGDVVKVEMRDKDQGPSEGFYNFVSLFMDVEAWPALMLEETLAFIADAPRRPEIWPTRIADAIRVASIDEFASIFDTFSNANARSKHAFWALRDVRDDSPEELIQLVKGCEREWHKEAALVTAILKHEEQGQPVPEAWDEHFNLESFYFSTGMNLFDGYDLLTRALDYLPAERRKAILLQRWEHDRDKKRVLAVLCHVDDSELRQIVREHVLALEETSFYRLNDYANALSRVGVDGLDFLVDLSKEASGNIPDLLRLARIYTLAEHAGSGATLWDEEHDALLDFTGWYKNDGDWCTYAATGLKTALEALPRERVETVLLDALDPSTPTVARVFESLCLCPTPRLLGHAFGLLAAHFDELRQPTRDHVMYGLQNLNKLAHPYVVAIMARDQASPKLLEAVKKAYQDKTYKELLAQAQELGAAPVAERPPFADITELAAAYLEQQPTAVTTTIYLLRREQDKQLSPESIQRIAGAPLGVSKERWPTFDDEPMSHAFTLDLDAMPLLKPQFPGTRALSLFVNSPDYNEAWEPFSGQTAIVLSSDEDVLKGVLWQEPSLDEDSAAAFSVHPVTVPVGIFTYGIDALKDLRNKVYAANARVLGDPIWLQGEEHFGEFVMQFDEGFSYMNLGDCGVMYVFSDTAFWQCH